MQYPERLLHSVELSKFSNLLMPNSVPCMFLIELSFRLHPKACENWPFVDQSPYVARKLWSNAIASP